MQEAHDSLFTCLSCSIAFHSAEDQSKSRSVVTLRIARDHYRSDHHRYNMKRRVAGLPPLSVAVFNEKVLVRRAETAVMLSPKGSTCEVCSKSYTTENAYRTHLGSRKHKENELKGPSEPKAKAIAVESDPSPAPTPPIEAESESAPQTQPQQPISIAVDTDASEDQVNQTIDEKIAAARSRLSPKQCLFCPEASASLEANLTHMSIAHSFFVPDAEYLVDLPGLLTYLGEKVAVGNVCIYCNGKGREFRTLDAVRKHMLDKGHCKILYDLEDDRLELSDFYDFTASYPGGRRAAGGGEWEDVDGDGSDDGDGDGEMDEVVDDDASDGDADELAENQVTYGDSNYELVLPSGARIGHRSMRRYYAQSFPRASRGSKPEDPNSGAAFVRRLLADKNSALVPRKGGFGAFGGGTDVVKARNRGEAREAGRHVREFRDQKRREDFKTKVGFIHNSQKHFRDPLLQVSDYACLDCMNPTLTSLLCSDSQL
ncbi:C2H2 type zinc-finger-domain-containing protein [Amylocystis lapponica]|nr:C2H2 type zinc-finger-domain-containing protein [Amylocystis lapponica]